MQEQVAGRSINSAICHNKRTKNSGEDLNRLERGAAMIVGIPRERKPFEYRVGLPPAGVQILTAEQHTVYVEDMAGQGAGFSNDDYIYAGASIAYSGEELYHRSDLIVKFAQPVQEETAWMQENQTIAGFLHLAAARQSLFDQLAARKTTAIAYEQIEDEQGTRPVLKPLSQIGGRMAAQTAARLMQNDHGGRGILLGGLPGIPPAEVVIIGAGVVGSTAARSFAGLGAHVTVLDINIQQLFALETTLPNACTTMLATKNNLELVASYADVIVGAVLVPGERAPIVLTEEMVGQMKPQSILIDLSIDQGGSSETSRPTTHENPTYIYKNVIHYCVPNVSGVIGRTASYALYNGFYPFLLQLACEGIEDTIKNNKALEKGLNLYHGEIRHLKRLGGI
ncbi:MAG: alanine dehydrogenase [Anaerolineales bacterium]|nr:alanine dehydrogenase [Anaerolineales bacterium]